LGLRCLPGGPGGICGAAAAPSEVGRLLSSMHRRAPAGPAAETRRPWWGKKRVEVARDAAGGQQGTARQAARPPDRTDSCSSRSSARCAVIAAAPATERSSRETAPLQPFVQDPDRPLAPSEGSNDGSRDRGRAASGAACERPPPDLPAADLPLGRAGHPRARARTGGAEGASGRRTAAGPRSSGSWAHAEEQDRRQRGSASAAADARLRWGR
jgi:hypothetical protein